jgi:hypothetical protein
MFLLACATMISATAFQLWDNNWEFRSVFSLFFFFLLFTSPIAVCFAFSPSPEAPAREKQSAEDLDILEAKHRLEMAAAQTKIAFHEDVAKSRLEKLGKRTTDLAKVSKQAGELIGLNEGLKAELKYAWQRIDEDRPATAHELEASLRKAHQEVADLKYSLALARALSAVPAPAPTPVAPVATIATIASDPAAPPVCEHQGLLAEKHELDLALAKTQRLKNRAETKLKATAWQLRQKESLLEAKGKEI